MLLFKNSDLNKKISVGSLKYPISIYLKITQRCNLKCYFCSQGGQKCEDMDLLNAKKILKYLKKIGVINIYYTGGEPLLYNEIYELLKYGYDLGFKQYLITNGLLLSNNKKILKYIHGLGVSLHGIENIHNKMVNSSNAFSKVITNLKQIDRKIFININCTIVNDNMSLDNIKFLTKLCKENNWKLSFARLNYIGNGEYINRINLNKMLALISKFDNINISNCIAPCTVSDKYSYLCHGCGAGFSIAAIETNGDVKICASSTVILGNAFNKKFSKIWNLNKKKMKKHLKNLPRTCQNCKHLLNCKGGCKAENNGEYWKECCDTIVLDKLESNWNIIKNKKIQLNFTNLRKERFGTYIILYHPSKVCNKNVKKILKKIDGTVSGNDILVKYHGSNEVKDILISLYESNLIFIID